MSEFDFLSLMGGDVKKDNTPSCTPTSYTYRFHLKGPVCGPEEYISWIDSILGATPNDTLEIHMNTPGGDVTAALEIMNALNQSPAHVHMVITGQCASAGTLIMASGDTFSIDEHCSFMFHNYSGGTYGKGNEMHQQLEFERKWSANLMNTVYKDILTQAEIKKMLNGQDFWFTAEEIGKRLKSRLEKRIEAAQEALGDQEAM